MRHCLLRYVVDLHQHLKFRKAWVSVVALFLLIQMEGVISVPAADRPAEKRNVLFIIADDLNADLGCYGDSRMKTPHLDRLAQQSVRFERAYCQFPFCNPSRASMMTGMRPNTTQIINLQVHFRSVLPNVVTLPQLFRNQGYFSARVGKIYHIGVPKGIGTPGLDDPPSWDVALNPIGRDRTDEAKIKRVLLEGKPEDTGVNKNIKLDWMSSEGTDEEQTDGKVTLESIKLLEEHKDKPFFLAVGYFRPHEPFVAPGKYFDLYPIDSIHLPAIPANEAKDKPAVSLPIKPANWGLRDIQCIEAIRAYDASISFVDAQVGKLLEAVDRLGLREKTIIVFVSDHGYMLGEHGQWMKQVLFEECTRVPLMISIPGMKTAGTTCPRTVELVDLYPTLAELAGLKPPDDLQGTSLAPLLEDPHHPWDRPAYSQVTRTTQKIKIPQFHGLSVRTERWRLTEWVGDKTGLELYDHDADPEEHVNLAAEPSAAKVVEELRPLLKAISPEKVNWEKSLTPQENQPGKKDSGETE